MRRFALAVLALATLASSACTDVTNLTNVEMQEDEVRILVLEQETVGFLPGQQPSNSVTFCAPQGVQVRFETAMGSPIVQVGSKALVIAPAVEACGVREHAWRAEMTLDAMAGVSTKGYFILSIDSSHKVWTVPFQIRVSWP